MTRPHNREYFGVEVVEHGHLRNYFNERRKDLNDNVMNVSGEALYQYGRVSKVLKKGWLLSLSIQRHKRLIHKLN